MGKAPSSSRCVTATPCPNIGEANEGGFFADESGTTELTLVPLWMQ
jgi:hypothetical protein